MPLTVLEPGLYSLLVDTGRPASRHLGVPVGGAADRAALALGNGLVGNPPDALALELTMTGPTLRAEQRTACVIFGSPFFAAVANKARVEPGTTFTLEPGDVLKIGGTPGGVRGYLCVAGGFAGPPVLNSASALEPISTDAVLACAESRVRARSLPFSSLPVEGDLVGVLRIVPGPQFDWFLTAKQFFQAEYEVLPASNRMGVRLRGPKLERRPGELISEPVAPGAVQITNDGQPIVLGVDGQTIGGYPKIAHVIRADLDRLAQLRPGGTVRFRQVIADEAEVAAAARESTIRGWLTRLEVTRGL
ncbi:5-oxoprolinase subunit C family protein [Limnoglobus roseus]|uniref:Allophanate hydrolase subunit 2 n=1 Tax=Limnoglobus roseus TaxID=2598579 RepID=A0A5C1AJN8_9BACT|nr:biotin-dependent carboxyltransferase family protein [Limnoglobus roseus]QEL17364.1 Allophanate hydrolase subunit 2 [Limnoglobus roseus]